MQTRINVGFIGAGKSTHRYQAPFILRRNDKFTIKTIWARNLNHIKWERIPNVNYTDDLESMLNDEEIELIVVSTPVMHYEYALMALEHGKHVLVEKPFANTSEEAKEIFDLASQKGLMAMCIQNRRFDSDFLTTQKVIESGKLGDVYEVEMHYDYYRKDVVDATDHFDSYLSFLYGHACHTLDQALSYFGKPNDYHMEVKQIMGKGRMNDYFDIDFYYDNALKVTIASSYMRIKHRPRFIVYGTKGMFVKATEDRQEADLKRFYMPTPEHPDFGMDREEHYGTITYYNEHNEYVEEKVPTVTGDYSRMYDAIFETIRSHKPQLVTPEQTLLQLKLLEEGIGQCE
ncbi:NAD(P)-dependent oxidoreductase [Sharpea azabuensis]|uniref:NAD(P)-dependent oxidoreductase n=1 Tax=Sharpea porci TaxID=2652286 RepID=A0A844FXQ7_9FIRM|nr:Gfo/Idh/MocA family oxidoreductase [Sharpea porci]MST90152.1 NAD(P)-dependent oxidoreductase [Sharpea porci]